jgi:hypothetical protein
MPLTDVAVCQARANKKEYKLCDERGVLLIIRPNGSKWWRLRYRFGGFENDQPPCSIRMSPCLWLANGVMPRGARLRARSSCGAVFRHAIGLRHLVRDITVDLRGLLEPPTVEHHAAITDPKRAGELLLDIDDYSGRLVTRCALRLLPLGYDGDEMTGHGFRTLASTLLNSQSRWNPDAIERQLAHTDSNEVRSAYNASDYLAERREMMQVYADELDVLRERARGRLQKLAVCHHPTSLPLQSAHGRLGHSALEPFITDLS